MDNEEKIRFEVKKILSEIFGLGQKNDDTTNFSIKLKKAIVTDNWDLISEVISDLKKYKVSHEDIAIKLAKRLEEVLSLKDWFKVKQVRHSLRDYLGSDLINGQYSKKEPILK